MSVPKGKRFSGKASKSRVAFYDASDDVRSFYAIAQALKGRRTMQRHLGAAGKGMFVLIAALWEGFCEDLAEEAAQALVSQAPAWRDIPPALARKISLDIKGDKNELSAWRLSGDAWRDVALCRVSHVAQTTIFNTPKTRQVDKLFDDALGIPKVSDSWVSNFAEEVAPGEALDAAITLRGALAHGQERDRLILKKDVSRFYQLVADLVDCTEVTVRHHLDQFGAELWHEDASVS